MGDAPQSTVEVTLLGKRYTFRCAKKEAKGLERAARYLDNALNGVRQHSQSKDDAKVAIMTALNITHEMLNHGDERQALEQEVEKLTERIDTALATTKSSKSEDNGEDSSQTPEE